MQLQNGTGREWKKQYTLSAMIGLLILWELAPRFCWPTPAVLTETIHDLELVLAGAVLCYLIRIILGLLF